MKDKFNKRSLELCGANGVANSTYKVVRNDYAVLSPREPLDESVPVITGSVICNTP